eukprot:ctg_1143.g412
MVHNPISVRASTAHACCRRCDSSTARAQRERFRRERAHGRESRAAARCGRGHAGHAAGGDGEEIGNLGAGHIGARRRTGGDTRAWRNSRTPHRDSRFWVCDPTRVGRFTAVGTDGVQRRPTRQQPADQVGAIWRGCVPVSSLSKVKHQARQAHWITGSAIHTRTHTLA